MNNRRKLVIALGAGALAAPFASVAQQQTKVWRVGFLAFGTRLDPVSSEVYGAFTQGMRELGYVEGKNLAMEWRFADGRAERLPGLAAEFVQLKVDVIVVQSNAAVSAAQKAITTIPIVMGSSGDAVGAGFIKSLARPGGNITGLTNIAEDVSAKHLEMLLDVVPRLSRVAILVHPDNSSHATILKNVRAVAQRTGVTILSLDARSPEEIENAFSQMARQKAGALIVTRDAIFNRQANQISELAARNRLPAIYGVRESVEAGGLISYGSSRTDSFRRAATYVDKIFKGANPGDLPVEQPTRFELVINMKTAKTLGVTIPQSILVRADRVIE